MKTKKTIGYYRPCYVYVMKCEDDTYYIGSTVDLRKCYQEHMAGRASKYTKEHIVTRYVWVESMPERHKERISKCKFRLKLMNRHGELQEFLNDLEQRQHTIAAQYVMNNLYL